MMNTDNAAITDFRKEYLDSLNRAKAILNNHDNRTKIYRDTRDILEDIFPCLKETGDEKLFRILREVLDEVQPSFYQFKGTPEAVLLGWVEGLVADREYLRCLIANKKEDTKEPTHLKGIPSNKI